MPGPAVETQKCGTGIGNKLECFYGNGISSPDVAVNNPEIQAEVGPYCRCGCVIHLGQAKPKRLLATSSQSCPGRTFWLIQADEDHCIQFKVEQFRLPCGSQWLKVRDGRSLSANLLADLSGASDTIPSLVNSTGPNLLLEFYTEQVAVGGEVCGGGFLAHATQIKLLQTNATSGPIAQSVGVIPAAALKLTAVHMAAIFFLSGLLIATALLGAQYLFRYRKYHIAQGDDQDSLADPTTSCASIPLTTRASSNATLLSEVISLTRLRPHMTPRYKHSRLRESMDYERDKNEAMLAKEEDSLSDESTVTLTQQETLTSALQTSKNEYIVISPSSTCCEQNMQRSSTTTSEKDSYREKDECEETKSLTRRFSTVSTATLTNVRATTETCSKSDPGCYSPAASMISTATIRSTNLKECKEKRNREKLLAGPVGSEFSLNNQDADLEMDYYDYNVVNAGAAPGSYLGMDPAFLVWIPPLDETGEILPEHHELHQDIRPKHYVDAGSNQESPEEEVLLPKPRKRSLSVSTPKSPKFNRIHPLIDKEYNSNESVKSDYEKTPLMKNAGSKIQVSIQLHEFPKRKLSESKITKEDEEKEKETKVEKSPSLDSNILDEIKYADDEEETDSQCNITIPYQDSNILSSS